VKSLSKLRKQLNRSMSSLRDRPCSDLERLNRQEQRAVDHYDLLGQALDKAGVFGSSPVSRPRLDLSL
jgi:hypothetical protein